MLRNVVSDRTRYAIRQRTEIAARIAPTATKGNRYRSWTRVGRMKNAIARIVTPVRITRGVGRRATSSDTITNAANSSTPPTMTAGNGPINTAWGQNALPGGGFRMTESHAQLPFAATPEPLTEASAHGL